MEKCANLIHNLFQFHTISDEIHTYLFSLFWHLFDNNGARNMSAYNTHQMKRV